MKKYFLLLFILCLQLVPTKAQWVTIPDANFVTILTQLYPSCMNGNQMDTTCSQIVNAWSVNVCSQNIADLTGIEYFDNLTQLKCSLNQLINLPPLPGTLQYIYCNNNQLTNLPSLPNTLTYLDCYDNQLTSLPALPSYLQTLSCYYNQLTSLPALPNSLYTFYCGNNLLTNLPPLPNSLYSFDCANNQLTSLPTSLPDSLRELGCDNIQLTVLPTLPNYLRKLWCRNNQLTSLPTLPSTMERLYCSYNQLTSLPSLSGISYSPYGFSLTCDHNQLTNLPPMPSHLIGLICGYNQLTNLPPLNLNYLSDLDCRNNQLTSLQQLPNWMWRLRIDSNNISCLINLPQVNIGSFPNFANLSGNPLTCIPNQTSYSLGLPLCMDNDPVNNPLNCPSVNITGFVYKDMNANCAYENTDLGSENIPVKLYNNQNNFVAYSSTVNGVYSFAALQPDTFKVMINDSTLLVSMACGQANYQSVILDFANQAISNINFPVVCDTVHDVYIQSVNRQGIVFPGQTHTLNTNITNNVVWYNLNCASTNYSGTISINITGPVTFFAPAPNALTPILNGNTFTYNITDFNTLTPQSFGLKFLTDTTAQAGDQICVQVEVNPIPLDADTINNSYNFCYQVSNSYDPNMKEVYPVNVLPGYDDWFTYTIHFQNTGNAPAFNIRLRDTLDTNLDINTFEIRGYSHPAIISINGNILTVRFNNIMLPDSTADYEGSMGYFQYRIKPLPNLPLGTQIENTAYIYFDYNAPIITNTTQNNFQLTVKSINMLSQTSHLSLFPNPSNGIFTFNENKNIKTVEVFNMMGELILSQGNAKQINLQAFPKGIYVARINGTFVARLVKE